MNQGEAAESVVRMSLNGTEMLVKVTGTGLKGAVALMYALYKDNKQLSGKTNLSNMLKSGKELKVFSIKEKDLEKFVKQAKKYGVLYSALLDKKGTNLDGMVDIMVRAEDAPKINRIVERFNLTTWDEAKIKAVIEKDKQAKILKEEKVKDIDDSSLVDEILGRTNNKEKELNPNSALMEKESPLEPLSKNKKNLEANSKKSVRAELKQIIKEQKEKGELNEKKPKSKENQKATKHTQPNRKKKKKINERGI